MSQPKHKRGCVRWDGQLWTCESGCPVANPPAPPTFPTTPVDLIKETRKRFRNMMADAGRAFDKAWKEGRIKHDADLHYDLLRVCECFAVLEETARVLQRMKRVGARKKKVA